MPTRKPKATRPTRAPKSDRSDVLARELRMREREVIVEYLERHSGNVGETARALGISRRALETKMLAHDLRSDAATLRGEAGIRGPRE